MRKSVSVAAVALSASLALTACGGSKTETKATTAPSQSSVAAGASTAPAADGDISEPSQCPTTAQQNFPKARFVTNMALAVAATNHWIVKPYKEKKFEKDAKGRTFTLVKAGLAGAFSLKQLNDAKKNVKADPTLCKAFIKPLSMLTSTLGTAVDKIKGGDISQIGALATGVAGMGAAASAAGVTLPDTLPTIPGLTP